MDTAHWTESEGTHRGMRWECMATSMGHRCGYVQIPVGHPLHGRRYGDSVPSFGWWEALKKKVSSYFHPVKKERVEVGDLFGVHGGLTFSGSRTENPGDWWLGFDCGHYNDRRDKTLMDERTLKFYSDFPLLLDSGTVRTQEYVEEECRSLARQIVEKYPL